MTSNQRLTASLTPLDRALAALLHELMPLDANEGPQADAPGYAATGLPELKAWPPHDIACVDGFALRAADLVGASSYTPLRLRQSPAWVEAGDRIPDGCDCVVDEDSVDRTGPIVQVLTEAIPGQGIRRKGFEIADASRIIDAWRPSGVQAGRRPWLRVVNIPGGSITARLIARSLQAVGVTVALVEATSRDAASIARLFDGSDCDLLVTVGGSGVGRTDAAVIALAECGEVIAHGLALQPGRTAAVGRIGRTPVIALPGLPDQALAVWWTLVLPVLERLAGWQRRTATRPLARKIASGVGIAEVVLLGESDGAWMPLAIGDLPLETVARARAWLLVPSGSEGYAAGTLVDAHILDAYILGDDR